MGRLFEVLRPHTRATPTLVHGVAVPDVRDGQGVLGEQAVVALQHQHQFLRVSVLKADHQVLWGKKWSFLNRCHQGGFVATRVLPIWYLKAPEILWTLLMFA